jgi:hypothetical protein
VLNHLKARDYIELRLGGDGYGQSLDGCVEVCETARLLEDGLFARVGFGDAEDLGRGIESEDGGGVRETRGRFGENASATANV